MSMSQNVSQRQFLGGIAGTAAGAVAFPYIIGSSALGKDGNVAPSETAHRSATPGHLGRIAMWLGRKIRFNPETEEIISDPTATAMLGRPLRSPWHL